MLTPLLSNFFLMRNFWPLVPPAWPKLSQHKQTGTTCNVFAHKHANNAQTSPMVLVFSRWAATTGFVFAGGRVVACQFDTIQHCLSTTSPNLCVCARGCKQRTQAGSTPTPHIVVKPHRQNYTGFYEWRDLQAIDWVRNKVRGGGVTVRYEVMDKTALKIFQIFVVQKKTSDAGFFFWKENLTR